MLEFALTNGELVHIDWMSGVLRCTSRDGALAR